MTNNKVEQLRNKYLQMARENNKIGSKLPKTLADDMEFFEQVIKLEPTLYTRASDRIKRNYNIALAATTKLDFMDISKEVGYEFLAADDGRFVLDAIAKEEEKHYHMWSDDGRHYFGRRGVLLASTPAGLFTNYSFTFKVLLLCPDAQYFTHHPAMSDPLLALIAMKLGIAYAYSLHEEFRKNYDITMAAVEQHGKLLEYASDDLKADKQVVLKAVKNNGLALQFASPELRDDFDVVDAALEHHGKLLEHASDHLKADKQVVLKAVKNNGLALQFASAELQDDFEVVEAAVQEYSFFTWDTKPLKYASHRIRSDREFIAKLSKNPRHALSYATSNLRKDVTFIHELMQFHPFNFYSAHPSLTKMAAGSDPVKFINSLLLKKKLDNELPSLEEDEEETNLAKI